MRHLPAFLVVSLLALGASACGGSGGGAAGDGSPAVPLATIEFTAGTATPTTGLPGQQVALQVGLMAAGDRHDLVVAMDLVDLTEAAVGLEAIDPKTESYDLLFPTPVHSHYIADFPEGTDDRTVWVQLPADLPAGPHAWVLRVYPRDQALAAGWIDGSTEAAPPDDFSAPVSRVEDYFVGPAPLIVTAPDRPNLLFATCSPIESVVDPDTQTRVPDPVSRDDSSLDSLVVPVLVEVEAELRSVDVPVEVKFRASTFAGQSVELEVLTDIDPVDPSNVTRAASYVFPVDPLTGFSFEVDEGTGADPDASPPRSTVGATVQLLLPPLIWNGLRPAGSDALVTIECFLDPADDVPEYEEVPGPPQADNYRSFSLAVLAPDPDAETITVEDFPPALRLPPAFEAAASTSPRPAATVTPSSLFAGRDVDGSPILAPGGIRTLSKGATYGNSRIGASWKTTMILARQPRDPMQTGDTVATWLRRGPQDLAKFAGGGNMDVRLFGSRWRLLDARAAAIIDVTHRRISGGYGVRVLGSTLYSRYRAVGCGQSVARLALDRSVSRQVAARQWITVGPVPLRVSAGARVTVGFDCGVDLRTGSISAHAGPYVDATAFATVDVIVAGVTGQVRLVRVDVQGQAELQLPIPLCPTAPTEWRLTLDTPVTFSTMNGRIYLWARYWRRYRRRPRWRRVTRTRTIVSWAGRSWVTRLAPRVTWSSN